MDAMIENDLEKRELRTPSEIVLGFSSRRSIFTPVVDATGARSCPVGLQIAGCFNLASDK